jgi:hypothetical protein
MLWMTWPGNMLSTVLSGGEARGIAPGSVTLTVPGLSVALAAVSGSSTTVTVTDETATATVTELVGSLVTGASWVLPSAPSVDLSSFEASVSLLQSIPKEGATGRACQKTFTLKTCFDKLSYPRMIPSCISHLFL